MYATKIKDDIVKYMDEGPSGAAEESKMTPEHKKNMIEITNYLENSANSKATIIGLTNKDIITKLNVVPLKIGTTKATTRGNLGMLLHDYYYDSPGDAKAFAIKIQK